MANLYSKIHRLKSLGWTWEHFLHKIDRIYPGGIDEKTLFALYRHPHRKASSHVKSLLTRLHDQEFPSPFPKDIECLLSLYNRRLYPINDSESPKDISDLLHFIEGDLNYGDSLRKARLHWLKADIHLDQIPIYRKNGQSQNVLHHKEKALKHYQTCHDLLTCKDQIPNMDSFTLYKVKQNMLACYLNSLHPKDRYQDNSILSHLKKTNYIEASKEVLKSEPYQWLIARNGLRFSSITKDINDCKFFFEALVSANKAFIDPSYTPDGAPAINNSEEFTWALKHLNL